LVLDLGGEADHGRRSVEDSDARFGRVLDEPMAVRGQDGRVQELVMDQDVRPGAGLGDRRGVRARVSGMDSVSSVAGAVARHEAGATDSNGIGEALDLRLCACQPHSGQRSTCRFSALAMFLFTVTAFFALVFADAVPWWRSEWLLRKRMSRS
jgi:hypothetical protein